MSEADTVAPSSGGSRTATGLQRPGVPRSGAPTSTWASSGGDLLTEHDVVLLDLDGVVYVGEQAVDGAAKALEQARARGARLAFVTNNAARTPDDVAEHLSAIGVPATADDVVTSAQAAAAVLADALPAGSRVLSVGAEGLAQALRDEGLEPVTAVDDGAVAVVQGFSPRLDWPMLLEACVAVRAGLPWVATNLDATLPTPRGPAPGNGAFVDVVRRTTGVEPQVAGKPYRPVLDTAVARTGARRPLMVGDRLDTDLAGARAAELPGLHVLTGVSAVVDLLAASAELRPSYLAADLHGLLEPHAAPTFVDGAWHGGQDPRVEARWEDATRQGGEASGPAESGGLLVTAPEDVGDGRVALEVVRVACAAVWSRADAQGTDRLDDDALAQARAALERWTAPRGWDR